MSSSGSSSPQKWHKITRNHLGRATKIRVAVILELMRGEGGVNLMCLDGSSHKKCTPSTTEVTEFFQADADSVITRIVGRVGE